MKEGREGEAPTIDNIEGIVVPMLSGDEFLVYPKYAELPILPAGKSMPGRDHNEVAALYDRDNHEETSALYAIGSPAAEYVRGLGKDMPSLQMLLAICRNRDSINAVADKIQGADKLWSSGLWSCCRGSSNSVWVASGNGSFFYIYNFYSSFVVVPVARLKVRKANA